MSEYEPTDEVFTWSITAAVVVIIVIVTIVIVCCILKKTPEREIQVTSSSQDGAGAGRNGTREASYHKYWDVTDPRSPMGANSAGRFIRRYIYGDLRSVEEIKRDEEAAMGIYRRGSNS